LPTERGSFTDAQPPTAGLSPSASDLAEGSRTRGGPVGQGGDFDVQTQVFGVPGRGSAFVYVFDRSSSMGGYRGAPLLAAKDELVKSLASLESVHQFQIIFYNEKPELMHLFRGQPATMVFADDRSKQLAARFVGGIQAYGSTKHLEALTMALQMRPDVIFFLTDADMPELTRDELDRIRRLNRGTVINAIEFGSASAARSHNFLKQLAAENGGQHGYVDVTKLPR
jgi:hypothetical protein